MEAPYPYIHADTLATDSLPSTRRIQQNGRGAADYAARAKQVDDSINGTVEGFTLAMQQSGYDDLLWSQPGQVNVDVLTE
jgi:hypothetical protein